MQKPIPSRVVGEKPSSATGVSKTQAFFAEPSKLHETITVAVAALGGFALMALGIPAGGMSGAMLAVAATSSLRVRGIVALGRVLRYAAMLLSGVSIGSAVTPEMAANVLHYPISILGMLLAVIAMTVVSTFVSSTFSGWDRKTALLAAVPGAMSYILSVVMAVKADAPRVVAVQMFRLFFLMALVPLLVVETGVPVGAIVLRAPDPWLVFVIECAVAYGAGWFLERMKVAAGMFLGAMLVSAAFHITAMAEGRAPIVAMIAGQVLIGAWAGSRFVGFNWGLFLKEAPSMLGAVAASLVTAAVFASAVAFLLGLPFGATFLAYAPGGFEAMTLLAMALGFDPFYVAAHHLARFFMLNLGLPLTLHYLLGTRRRR